MSFQTGPGRVTLLLLIAIAGQGSDAIAQGPTVQYNPLQASGLPATPVLAMTEISYESKTGAAVAGSDLAATVAALERQGAANPLLPPHAMLPKPSVAAPLPPPAATNDSTKSKQRLKPGVSSEMWQSMVNHADSVGARANDDALL